MFYYRQDRDGKVKMGSSICCCSDSYLLSIHLYRHLYHVWPHPQSQWQVSVTCIDICTMFGLTPNLSGQ